MWLWRLFRRPTKIELYEWLLAEYGTRKADPELRQNLEILIKMDLLYRRIKVERQLLQEDIAEARRFDLDIDWVESPTIEIIKKRNSGFKIKKPFGIS